MLYDRFFSSAGAGSFLNHIYWVAASPGAGYDRVPPNGFGNLPTIFDRLQQAHVSWKFYVQNYEPRLNYRTMNQFPGNRASQVIWVPILNFARYLRDPGFMRHVVGLDQYYKDLEAGKLPEVSFIAPSGPSEHPPSSLASGQAFVRSLINALMRSSNWKSSAFMLAYDDWGGWYDHVKPPQVDAFGLGFRVPALLVSPYARQGYVDKHDSRLHVDAQVHRGQLEPAAADAARPQREQHRAAASTSPSLRGKRGSSPPTAAPAKRFG